jgi:hypothetical protein
MKSAGPFMVSMYWLMTRHMWPPNSPPSIHFDPPALGFRWYILGVELLMILSEVKSPNLPPSDA